MKNGNPKKKKTFEYQTVIKQMLNIIFLHILNNGFFRERESGRPISPNRISLAESLPKESGLGQSKSCLL